MKKKNKMIGRKPMLTRKVSINNGVKFVAMLFLVLFMAGFVSAGVGIKWDRESALAAGGEEACLTYGVYNPWNEDTYVEVGVSEELEEVLLVQDVNSTLVPANTPSGDSIPVEFCFEVPSGLYDKDCWLGNFFVCEQACNEEQRIYEGEVEIRSVPPPSGAAGSAAVMAVSAPLRVKVRCDAHGRDYTVLYILLGIIAFVVIILTFKYRKPREQRIREEMAELRAKLKSTKKSNKK
jgi:hypothetical protein